MPEWDQAPPIDSDSSEWKKAPTVKRATALARQGPQTGGPSAPTATARQLSAPGSKKPIRMGLAGSGRGSEQEERPDPLLQQFQQKRAAMAKRRLGPSKMTPQEEAAEMPGTKGTLARTGLSLLEMVGMGGRPAEAISPERVAGKALLAASPEAFLGKTAAKVVGTAVGEAFMAPEIARGIRAKNPLQALTAAAIGGVPAIAHGVGKVAERVRPRGVEAPAHPQTVTRNGRVYELSGVSEKTGKPTYRLRRETPGATVQEEQVKGAATPDVRAGEGGQTGKGRGRRQGAGQQGQQATGARQVQEAQVQEGVTGARKAITIPEREARGLPEVEMQLYKRYGPSYMEGRQAVEKGHIDPRALATEIASSPRTPKPHETGALTYDRVRLNNDVKDAYAKADAALASGDKAAYQNQKARIGQTLDLLDVNDQALRRGGREASAALSAFQQVAKEDYSLGTLLQKRRVATGKSELTPKDEAQVRTLKEQLDKAQETLTQHEARIKELEIGRTISRVARVTDPRKTGFGEKNTVFTLDRKNAAAQRIRQKMGTLSAGVDPTLVADAAEIGGYYVEGGVRAFGQWSREMRKEIPGITDDVLKAAWSQVTNDKRLAAAKKRLETQTAEIKAQTAAGAKTPKAPALEYDAEHAKLLAQRDAAKQELDRLTSAEKPTSIWKRITQIHREFILSGYSVLQKLFGATVWGYPTETAADIVGAGVRKVVPGAKRLSKISGGREAAPLGTALKGAVRGARALASRQAVRNAWDTIRTGANDVSTLAGVRPKGQELGGYVGRFHGAEKAFLQTGEFHRSGLIRTRQAIENGLNVNDPEVQAQIFRDSAVDAWNNILQGDNRMASALTDAMHAIERRSPLGGTIARTLVPITRVSSNIVGRGLEMTGLGIPRGAYLQVKAIMAERAGIEVTPQQATAILKAYKYGGLGLVAAYLGWNQPKGFQSGGWYSPEKKPERQGQLGLKPDELRIAGVKVPAILAHAPFLFSVQFWATMRQAYDRGGVASAIAAVTHGVASQTPGIEATKEVAQATMDREGAMGKASGTYVRGLTEPQLMQQIAKWLDGQTVRKPRGFREELMVGVPGIRQKVPTKKSPMVQAMERELRGGLKSGLTP